MNPDGTHPSVAGRTKVGTQLLEHFLTDPHAQFWFLSPTAGDFDEDGDDDGANFLKWQQGELSDPPIASDLAVWVDNYGVVIPHSAISAAVPEPASARLLVRAIAGFFVQSRQSSRASLGRIS